MLCKGFEALAENTISSFRLEELQHLLTPAALQGRLPLFSSLLCLLSLSCFKSANPNPKPTNLEASGGLGVEGEFLMGLVTSLGHFAILGNYS